MTSTKTRSFIRNGSRTRGLRRRRESEQFSIELWYSRDRGGMQPEGSHRSGTYLEMWWWGFMAWACFRSSDANPLCRLDGRFNSAKYLGMLSNIVEPFAHENKSPNWIYEQDNSPLHMARGIKKWFKDNNCNVLDRAHQSPNWSPIEQLSMSKTSGQLSKDS